MNSDTSKATARPWVADGIMITDTTGGFVGMCGNHPTPGGRLDAALIVERVNGWDALVAERDSLRVTVTTMRAALNERVAERDRLAEKLGKAEGIIKRAQEQAEHAAFCPAARANPLQPPCECWLREFDSGCDEFNA